MRWMKVVRNTLRSLFLRRRVETELNEEFQDHLEQEIENNIRAGLAPQEARIAALRLIGPISLHREECRDSRGTAFIETCLRDGRYAARMLARTPLFTAAAVVTLALGIGANTTVFTFVENIVLRQLPVRDPEQLVSLNWDGMQNISYPNYADFRERNRAFSGLIACRYVPVSMSIRPRENYRVWGAEATGNYFETLGIQPSLGRFFSPEDDRPGAVPTIVISDRFWRSHFAADPDAIGTKIKINGFPFTIIGVAPRGFGGTELIVNADYWVPVNLELLVEPGDDWIHSRYSQNMWTLGRLKPGVSKSQAEEDLNRISRELGAEHPDILDRKGGGFHLVAPGLIGDSLRRPITAFGTVLMLVSGLVLMLACVNLAGMLTARASDRRREIGIRLALGASKLRLLGQLMIESLILASTGGILGFGLAFAACRLFSSWNLKFDIPFETALRPDVAVLAFTAAVALFTTLLFGLAPAIQAVRTDLIPSIKDGSSRRLRKWSVRDLIVAGQVALSVVLLICSALVIRSLQHALQMNIGFEPANAVSATFDLRLQGYDRNRQRGFDAALLAKASALPGMQAVGLINNLPLRIEGENNSAVSRAGRPVPPPSERVGAVVYNISHGYLQAAGTKLLRGRNINNQDHEGAPRVALVNQAFSSLLFPNENPLGKHFRTTMDSADAGMEIVGVVETGKYESLGEPPKPAIFLPIEQTGADETTLVARTALPPEQAIQLLRKTILNLDPELTLYSVGTLKDLLGLPLFPARAAATVLGVFGFLAIVLAATGLFALMSYAVARRTREIGIRMALGARAGSVLSSILKRTLLLSAIGVVLGSFAALAAGRLLSAVLYGVSPRDPVTYAAAILLLTFVAVGACWRPAVRAIHIDPARTLREE